MFRQAILLLCTLILALPAVASAAIMTPPGLQAGDQFRLAFLTDGTTNATANDLASYDSIVANEAASAGLDTYFSNPVTWQAIVSTDDVGAKDRLPNSIVPIYRLDGVQLSDGMLWGGSSSQLNDPLTLTPTFQRIGVQVWTGMAANGDPYTGEVSAYVGEPNVRYGLSGVVFSEYWVDFSNDPNTNLKHLYAFSSVLEVPAQAVPEPAGLTLALSATLLIGALGRRRRARQVSPQSE